MKALFLFIGLAALYAVADGYIIGLGRADCTGPSVGKYFISLYFAIHNQNNIFCMFYIFTYCIVFF